MQKKGLGALEDRRSPAHGLPPRVSSTRSEGLNLTQLGTPDLFGHEVGPRLLAGDGDLIHSVSVDKQVGSQSPAPVVSVVFPASSALTQLLRQAHQ